MAVIIGGLATSHSPQLSTGPEIWVQHAQRDQGHPWIDFDSLVSRAERELPDLQAELTMEAFEKKYELCQQALGELRRWYNALQPDVVVIIGDDQDELFQRDGLPALAVYWGDSVLDIPRPLEKLHESQRAGEWAYHGTTPEARPTAGAMGRHIIGELTAEEFDLTQLEHQAEGRSIGHAFTFIQRRIMLDAMAPIVPVMINTYIAPNVPSPGRCLRFGRALGRAIRSWPGDDRVLVVGSGGLSHFRVDEELDRGVLAALEQSDWQALADLPVDELVLGTSEIRNWIAAAGALEGFEMETLAYVPAYRSKAATGCGMGFARWIPR